MIDRTGDADGFWRACEEGRLEIQRCRTCRAWQHYPRVRCTTCGGHDLAYEEVSGRGIVVSHSVVWRAPLPELQDAVPYVIALVRLDCGVQLMTRIVDCALEELRCDLPVQVAFATMANGVTAPVFHPLTG